MKRSTGLMLLVLLVATTLRLYRVSEISLRADEAVNLYLAASEPGEILRAFVSSDPHSPPYYLILHFWMLIAGRSELAVRFPTILTALLIVALTYWLARTVFPRRSGIHLIAALLVAINPYLIWDAQDAYMYSVLTALAVAAWILFLRVMKPGASRRMWVSYVIVSALGLYLHYLAVLILVAQGVAWLFLLTRRELTCHAAVMWIGAQVGIALLFLPWLVLAFPLIANFKSDFLDSIPLSDMLARSLVAFSVGRVDSRLMPPMIDPTAGYALSSVFLLMLFVGLLYGKDVRGRTILAISLLPPLIAMFLFSILRFPIFDERYVLYLIPMFLLLIARGVSVLRDWTQRRWMTAGAIVFILAASGYSLNNYFNVSAYAKSPDWRAFMLALSAQAQPGDVLVQNYPDPALPYYLQDRIPRVLLPRVSPSNAGDVATDMERLTAKYERVWVQPVPFGEWDTDGLVAAWLDRYARLVSTYEFRGLQLALYLPARTALRQAQPSDALFDGRISLLAYDLDDSARFRPGQTAHLILYWQAHARTPHDLTVFVYLYDADGKLWSQQDTPPIHGTYPTSEWSAGEIIVDRYDVRIPSNVPAGTYLLAVGMYDSQTQERVKAMNGRGQLFPQDYVPLQRVGW